MKRTLTTCLMPYYSTAHITVDGRLKMCCYQNRSYTTSLTSYIKKEPNFISKVIQDMESWKKHNACSNCYKLEEQWIDSPRINFNNQYKNKDLKWDYKIRIINIRFSNICNLSCRMCNSESSSSRQKLDKHLWMRKYKTQKFNDETKFFLFNFTNVKHLEVIDIKGGEPFLHRDHFDFLNFLILKGLSKNIELVYNTNSTISLEEHSIFLPWEYKNIEDIFQNFKKVTLWLSLDGYKEVNEYIRTGSKWCDIKKNIEFYKKMNITLLITPTIQIDNILNIPKLLLFAESQKIPVYIGGGNFLKFPDYYSISILPLYMKSYVVRYYNKFLNNSLLENESKMHLEKILKYLYISDSDLVLFKKYVLYTKKIDTFLGLEFKTKLFTLYEKHQSD